VFGRRRNICASDRRVPLFTRVIACDGSRISKTAAARRRTAHQKNVDRKSGRTRYQAKRWFGVVACQKFGTVYCVQHRRVERLPEPTAIHGGAATSDGAT